VGSHHANSRDPAGELAEEWGEDRGTFGAQLRNRFTSVPTSAIGHGMKSTHELMERADVNVSTTADIPPIVLLVEDHIDTLDVYDAMLSRCGYWVARAVNGLEALECARDLQPDAIVTDVGLPGEMNGTDLIRELHADQKLRDVPVLVVTGRDPRDLPSFAGLVVSGLLLKPVVPETLVGTIERILDARSRSTENGPPPGDGAYA
jgi:CheY-like chemotaxis protein